MSFSIRILIRLVLIYLVMSASQTALAVSAGSVGEENYNLKTSRARCDSGKVAVGINVYAGIYIHKIRVICADVKNNLLTKTISNGSSTGGSLRASHRKTRTCPANYVLSGIKAKGGTYVDRVNSIQCTQYKGTGKKYVDVGAGGTGGNNTIRMYCPGTSRFTHILGYYGSWLNAMEVFCK